MEFSLEIQNKIKLLQDKYESQGQDLSTYLDALLYSRMPNYWDYVQVDTLLSLQKTYTDFPDELVFLMYHQITELYFKLAIHEFEQISTKEDLKAAFFVEHVSRINRYFEALTKSFEIMVDGMEREQFLKFRLSLAPASGFQSAQYRKIEISATDFVQLIHKDVRNQFSGSESIDQMFQHIYWKEGATDAATGEKTLTLIQFENRYRNEFIELGEAKRKVNLWQCYQRLTETDQQNTDVKSALRQLDINVNVNWPLAHYKSAVRYLNRGNDDIAATGGTNWQKYLPPRFQKRIFYPELWSTLEKEEWGKSWVETLLN